MISHIVGDEGTVFFVEVHYSKLIHEEGMLGVGISILEALMNQWI